jgi:hypothetical protein
MTHTRPIVLLTFLAACQTSTGPASLSDEKVAVSLHGLSLAGPTNTQTIFLGTSKDLDKEYRDVLANRRLNAPWYMVSVDAGKLPATSETITYDLATHAGLRLRANVSQPGPVPNGPPEYRVFDFTSRGTGLKGTVMVFGTEVFQSRAGELQVEDGAFGIQMNVEFVGETDASGMTYRGRIRFNVGAPFATAR